jgi:hypothetical protein
VIVFQQILSFFFTENWEICISSIDTTSFAKFLGNFHQIFDIKKWKEKRKKPDEKPSIFTT